MKIVISKFGDIIDSRIDHKSLIKVNTWKNIESDLISLNFRSVYVYSWTWYHLWMEIRSNRGWFRSLLTLTTSIAIFMLTEFCTVLLLFYHLVCLKLVRRKRISEYQEYLRMKIILFLLIFVPHHRKWLFHL